MKDKLKNFIFNNLGWKTDRKIIVFESDDWGTIRMSSKVSYKKLLAKGYPVDKCPYNRNDTLENNDDVSNLAEVLLSVKDKNQNPAKFTLDNIVANPDFGKIKESGFNNYYFEPFIKTYEKYEKSDKVFSLFKKGISEKVFQPQFHGREHVNINRWLNALKNKNQLFLDAFDENMFTVAVTKPPKGRRGFLDSFGENYDFEYQSYDLIIKEGTLLFNDIWGFKSKTFIAPCYNWSPRIEPFLKKAGINGLQGTHVQRIPLQNKDYKIKKKFHFTGQKNKFNQYYLVRNVFFEPTENGYRSQIDRALKEIDFSFKYNKPAIISSHRLNYIGSLNPKNREINLKSLGLLLKKIVVKYPEVEFMSSDELLELIKSN